MRETAGAAATVVRFDCFEVDLAAGRLYKRGAHIRLREKSFQILVRLIEHSGQVVTREELQHQLWPDDVFVDFENNLNTAIARLREALGDSAEHPRFIETLPKRGYRLVAAVSAAPRSAARALVLPFVNPHGDPADEYLSDAMTDEITSGLARIAPGQLGVIARTTAMHYKRTRKDVGRIARELAVDHIVEGTVRRAGERLTVNVQLTDPRDRTCSWAQEYDLGIGEIPDGARIISQSVAARLGVATAAAVSGPGARKMSRDVVAYSEYVKGRLAMGSATPEAFSRGKAHLERAIARDPQFALAYDGLAEMYWYLGYFGFMPPREAFSTGVLFAVRALEIDNTLAETHALLGQYHKQLRCDWPEVEREMARARQLDPASPIVRARYAFNYLMPHARIDEAVAELEQALDLDPLSTYMRTLLAATLLLGHRFEEAIDQARVVLELDANAYWGHAVIASCYRDQRRFDEAIPAQRKAVEVSAGASIMLGWLGLVLGLAGNTHEARALLQCLHTRAVDRYVPPASFAWIHIGLAEIDEAFSWLDRAVDGLDQLIMPIKSYAFLEPLRSDARYVALVLKMNLQP